MFVKLSLVKYCHTFKHNNVHRIITIDKLSDITFVTLSLVTCHTVRDNVRHVITCDILYFQTNVRHFITGDLSHCPTKRSSRYHLWHVILSNRTFVTLSLVACHTVRQNVRHFITCRISYCQTERSSRYHLWHITCGILSDRAFITLSLVIDCRSLPSYRCSILIHAYTVT